MRAEDEIHAKLRKYGVHMKSEWLQQCFAFLESRDLPAEELHEAIYQQVLHSDFGIAGSGDVLPEGVLQWQEGVLKGPVVLQIDAMIDVSHNYEERTSPPNGRAIPRGMFKLLLSDGQQQICGFEFNRINDLSNSSPQGMKVMVQNVQVECGILVLTSDNTSVLGGSKNANKRVSEGSESTSMQGVQSLRKVSPPLQVHQLQNQDQRSTNYNSCSNAEERARENQYEIANTTEDKEEEKREKKKNATNSGDESKVNGSVRGFLAPANGHSRQTSYECRSSSTQVFVSTTDVCGESASQTSTTYSSSSTSQPTPVRHLKFRSSPVVQANVEASHDIKTNIGIKRHCDRISGGTVGENKSLEAANAISSCMPWSLISSLPPEDSNASELLSMNIAERSWRIKGVVTETVGIKIKRKFCELRVYVDDGSINNPRLMFFDQQMVLNLFNVQSPESLQQQKKDNLTAFNTILGRIATILRGYEGIMTICYKEPPQEKGRLLPCILNCVKPTTTAQKNRKGCTSKSDLEALIDYGEELLRAK